MSEYKCGICGCTFEFDDCGKMNEHLRECKFSNHPPKFKRGEMMQSLIDGSICAVKDIDVICMQENGEPWNAMYMYVCQDENGREMKLFGDSINAGYKSMKERQ